MPPDPFETLGLPPAYRIDPAALQRAYLLKSASLHPDLADDPLAAESSAALNRARQVLEDPEARADALLLRLGGPPREAERSLPDGFLAEIMSVREELQDAALSGDSAARHRLKQWADERRDAHIASVTRRFDALPPTPTPAHLRDIRRELNAWRYIERMLEQIDAPGAM